jgi:hypothetical protein
MPGTDMQSPPKSGAASILSQMLSQVVAVDIRVAASTAGFQLYVDAILRYGNGLQRIIDLRKIPHRIRIGGKDCLVPRKERQTLSRLAVWEHDFDSRRGFVFGEKDVPDVLKHLRSQGGATFAKSANEITIDDRPMEYSHDVRENGRNLQIATVVKHPNLEITVTKEEQIRFTEGSTYAHVGSGYFAKPKPPGFKTIEARIGVVELSGDQIPLFLLRDLKRLRSNRRNKISREVEIMNAITAPFEPRVSFELDEPWIWFDLTYRAGSFVLPFQRIEQASAEEQFIRGGETWVRVDKKAHARLSKCISQIPDIERVQEHFRAPARHFLETHGLFSDVAVVNLSEACIKYARRFQRAAAR